jgi:hypothetical protein
MMEERIPQIHYAEDWRRGYDAGLVAPGDIPSTLPGGLTAFNMGLIAGMKASRQQLEVADHIRTDR